MTEEHLLDRAVDWLRRADALLIGAGAGMGVDSGLPDFRGNEGFWNAYPPFCKLGLSFIELANPRWFRDDPQLAWGFYGHRRNLYRATQPHAGFALLRSWAERMSLGAAVFTSNVDGHFQHAGFDSARIYEVHGSLNWLQCTRNCGAGVFAANASAIDIDETTFRAREPLPRCPACGALARPNVLMFGDYGWDSSRAAPQEQRLAEWLSALGDLALVVIECGAGTAIPTVRRFCERMATMNHGRLIRINLREPDVPPGHIGLSMGALAALRELDARLTCSK